MSSEYLDLEERAAEKAASRAVNERRLDSGEVTPEELREENSFVPKSMRERMRVVRRGRVKISNLAIVEVFQHLRAPDLMA